MWRRLKTFLSIFFILFLSFKAESQNLITTFVDPCTKATTTFTIPINGPTIIFFYGQSRQFTAADVSSGVFSSWINQVYADYRKVSPCSVQQVSITRNQITSQMVSNVVSSVIGSLNSSMSSSVVSSGSSSGGDDNASKGKTQSEKKKNKNENSNNTNSNSTASSGGVGNASTNTTNGGSSKVGNSNNNQSNKTNDNANQTNSQQNGGNGQGTVGNSGSVGSSGNSSTSSNQTGNNQSQSKADEKGETVATTVMNVDVRNDKGSDNSSSSGGGSKKSSSSQKQKGGNPIIVSSDLTSAQNLDKSFTGIINVGMSQSSMTGTSSWGVTSMVWFNLKQFAVNGRYTMMKMNNKGTLKFVHNINLTGAYSYGNIFGFLGYSIIVNAGKWGITGGNVSGALTKTPDDKNLFISPSFTAFYTRPFQPSKKLTLSPEIYLISTPVVYSSVDKITVTDRYFSAFLGTGADFQLTRRFKINVNYKANLSTNPEFPILSFFLIGSKINL